MATKLDTLHNTCDSISAGAARLPQSRDEECLKPPGEEEDDEGSRRPCKVRDPFAPMRAQVEEHQADWEQWMEVWEREGGDGGMEAIRGNWNDFCAHQVALFNSSGFTEDGANAACSRATNSAWNCVRMRGDISQI